MMRFLRESIAQDDVAVPPALRDEVELVASLKDMFEQVRCPDTAATVYVSTPRP